MFARRTPLFEPTFPDIIFQIHKLVRVLHNASVVDVGPHKAGHQCTKGKEHEAVGELVHN